MKIEVGKFYKNRNGQKVRIYALDGINGEVHGAACIHSEHDWRICSWNIHGHYLSTPGSGFDIISEWTEPKKLYAYRDKKLGRLFTVESLNNNFDAEFERVPHLDGEVK